MTQPLIRRSARGFTVIEALVALMIVGFGMLTLVGVQLTLERNAEVARQRTEATRIAQGIIEQQRAFNSIAGASPSWNTLASGNGTVTAATAGSNTEYTTSWTYGGTVDDTRRALAVTVSWTDRAGGGAAVNSVTLNTYIAKLDPALAGALSFPLPGNGQIKYPKNRSLNIPLQSTDLGNGQSSIPIGSWTAVFDNDSGWVVKYCAGTVTTAADAAGCSTVNAYILAGYISGSTSAVTGINLASLTGSSSKGASDCSFGDAKNPNTGATISGYKYYICVIEVSGEGASYGGTVRLAGMAAGTNYLVCRFQYSTDDDLTDNERNFQPYSNVADSLDQQNYYVVATNSNNCPTVSGLALTKHQECQTTNLLRLAHCPAVADS